MKFQKFDLFPTSVLKFDVSELFDFNQISNMIADIDMLCNQPNVMQFNDLTPKFQSRPILFFDDAPVHWHVLNDSFKQCCEMYHHQVDSFVNEPSNLTITGTRAWFYKGWKSLNKNETNPWHSHYPSFLSGVFYLKIPEAPGGGTTFMDPRLNEAKATRMTTIAPSTLCWVIFPGWLNHQSEFSDSEDPRYVIAADCYVKCL